MSCVVYKLICLFYWSRDISYLNIKRFFLFCIVCCTRLYICWIAFMRFLEERVFISWLFHLRSYIDFYWFCFKKITVTERMLACLWSIVFYGIVLKNGLLPDILFLWGGSAVRWLDYENRLEIVSKEIHSRK